jgi:hypothetical protein
MGASWQGPRYGPQSPLSADGDSVYEKDLKSQLSDVGTFDGADLDTLFNNLDDSIVDSDATNPKWFKFFLERPITAGSVGIIAHEGNFSNVKIEFLDRQGTALAENDDSTSDTKHTAYKYSIVATNVCCIKISFHTADTVTVSFLRIQKDTTTASRLKAIRPDGKEAEIAASIDGLLKIMDGASPIEIARGNVTGYDVVHKFGRGADIDSADGMVDLWDGAHYNASLKSYSYSTSADITHLSSDDNGDTQLLEVQGLTGLGDLVIQTKALTGQTKAALDTPLQRVFRVKNLGSTDNAGHVFCFVDDTTTGGVPDTIVNVRALIDQGNNQTLMAMYTIPTTINGLTVESAYIVEWHGSLSSPKASSFMDIEMRRRESGGVFQLKHTSTLSSAGTSHVQHPFVIPQAVAPAADIIMRGSSSVNDNAVSAGFDMIIASS